MVAASEPIARKLRTIDGAQWPVQFSHVTQPAQAFLVATIANGMEKTIWVLCPNVHSQELVYESLLNWQPTALFLPEEEVAAVENVLPDPEIAAAARRRCPCQKRSLPPSKMFCPIQKSQPNGSRCLRRSSARPVRI